LISTYKVKIVSENNYPEIHLTAIGGPMNSRALKNILRIDGVYYDIKRMGMNRPIKKAIKMSDGVIFQSNWSKLFVETMLQTKARKYAIIYNGTKQGHKFLKIKKNHDKMFVCCAIWRTNKRLETILKAFLDAKTKISADIGLFVIGKPDITIKDAAIYYLGNVGKEINSYLYASDYMCHICHLDACPNSVIEGLSAGLPVLCNNIGGTPEIVQKSGISLQLDAPFNFKAIANMECVGPKSIDYNTVSNGIIEMINKKWNVVRPDLSIKVSAEKYYKFFCSLLS